MDFTKILEGFIPILGQIGVNKLAEEFKDLAADQDKPWKQASLSLLADAVQAHGPAGVALAYKAIQDLFENKVPSIDWANPRTASDIVAKLQNAEADDKSAANEFFVKVGDSLGKLFTAVIKGMSA